MIENNNICKYNKLNYASQEILNSHNIRKTSLQKKNFRDYTASFLKKYNWNTTIDKNGKLIKNNNIIAGDLNKADIVFTAHYDTPAKMPFPNFITPENIFLTLLYQTFIAIIIVFIPILFVNITTFILYELFSFVLSGTIASIILLLCLLAEMFLIIAGPANPNNKNDNTSGILTLLEIAAAIPAEKQSNIAIVFFDNEELGLVGSMHLKNKYKHLQNKLIINFDCVGNGDTILFMGSSLRKNKQIEKEIECAFINTEKSENKICKINKSKLVFYPSDQLMFKNGIGVGAFKKHPLFGLYTPYLHTKKDTVLDENNVLLLKDFSIKLACSSISLK